MVRAKGKTSFRDRAKKAAEEHLENGRILFEMLFEKIKTPSGILISSFAFCMLVCGVAFGLKNYVFPGQPVDDFSYKEAAKEAEKNVKMNDGVVETKEKSSEKKDVSSEKKDDEKTESSNSSNKKRFSTSTPSTRGFHYNSQDTSGSSTLAGRVDTPESNTNTEQGSEPENTSNSGETEETVGPVVEPNEPVTPEPVVDPEPQEPSVPSEPSEPVVENPGESVEE